MEHDRTQAVLIHHPNWRGKPLVSYQAIVWLIAATTTRNGLNVKAEIDHASYPIGIKATDAEMAAINLKADELHREWNYTINPSLGDGAFINLQTLETCRPATSAATIGGSLRIATTWSVSTMSWSWLIVNNQGAMTFYALSSSMLSLSNATRHRVNKATMLPRKSLAASVTSLSAMMDVCSQ